MQMLAVVHVVHPGMADKHATKIWLQRVVVSASLTGAGSLGVEIIA